jgi:hypothetical protein
MIKAMTDLTAQLADPLKAEMHDRMATRQQLEGSLHSWRMQQHFPPVDENAKRKKSESYPLRNPKIRRLPIRSNTPSQRSLP